MVQDIIIGRNETDRKKYGRMGAILLGKQFVKMGNITSLANKIYMDVTRSHVVFVCGKRGGGKSYTMGVIAEGMANLEPEIAANLNVILADTMGIYWTMKYPNHKDEILLREWGLEGKGLDVKIFTPEGFHKQFIKEGIPSDVPFALKVSDLTVEDWLLTFELAPNDPTGVLIERIITNMREKEEDFGVEDIIKQIQSDDRAPAVTKDAAENRFLSTKGWGVFSKEGTKITDLVAGGQITVLDLSAYATMPGGWKIKSLVLGIVSMRLFIERMKARKVEEFDDIKSKVHYLTEKPPEKKKLPMIWLVVDEAHEFLPKEEIGKTASTDALVTILREGRQPGISLILATQQPGKIHTDVMTQSDILISHRITAKLDVDALSKLMQSYLRSGLDKELDNLPRLKGAGIIVDDTNERLSPMRIRPRFTWHGGEAPDAMPQKLK